jgi:DNA-binding response OmpR family regulator
VADRPVLVVEDDPDIREALAATLASEGYAVQTAPDGVEALRLIERTRPSLLVTDLHMPNLGGEALVATLHDRGFDPPILVISCTTRTLEIVAAGMGAAGCLIKPFNLDAFLTLVAQLRIP